LVDFQQLDSVNRRPVGVSLDLPRSSAAQGCRSQAALLELLAIPRRAGITGHFHVMPHAQQRQVERAVTRADLRSALRTVRGARPARRGRWRLIGGRDLAGDEVTLVIEIRICLIVVTVY
jgi:hypothetical protein